jgi:predicted ATPase/DNA-binding NarL/FixJ family response regulator
MVATSLSTREVTMAHVVARGQVTVPRRLGLLPAEATGFVGREDELAGLASLLGTARLVTVTGPAGVGKTRLALRAAAEAAGRYPDGVRLVDLGGIGDPGLVGDAVAAALARVREDSVREDSVREDSVREDSVREERAGEDGTGWPSALGQLRRRELLLILDTCEHLVDACGELADTVLRCAPGVTLIATSRQPLDVPGEHAFPLLPLPAGSAAVELFSQRAAAAVPGFSVTPANRADVVRLCRRLDGIPLAIEFAAVRLRALPLPELVSQLESGIRALTVSRRGTSPRHQTLRAAIEWSYQLCGPAERTLWERLSVFAGTFGVSGAEYVCADPRLPREQVVPALVGLVDKSVVLRDVADPSRYRLLGAQREFGADRLADADATERFLDRLTAWSVALARNFDEGFRASGGPPGDPAASRHAAPGMAGTGMAGTGMAGTGRAPVDQAGALRALRQEQENLRAALSHALDAEQQPGPRTGPPTADAAARLRLGAYLAVRLSCYWQVSGQLHEGRQWLSRVAGLFPEPARERAWALGARGQLAAFEGNLAAALDDISESIRLAAAIGRGAESAVARGYLLLAMTLGFAGRHADAMTAAETARRQLTACAQASGLIELQAQLAHLHQLAGNTEEAVACCEHGLALLGAAGRERWLGGHLYLIAGLALVRHPGREEAAAVALRRALTAKHALGDVLGTAYAVEAVAWLAAQREQGERTAWLLGAADQLWAATGRRLSGIAVLEESRQHAVTSAREALGDRRYLAAYCHGAALDLNTVVREALAEAGELPAEAGGNCAGTGHDAAAAGPQAVAALLTRREREIALLVANGLSNREIGGQLFISKRTVDAHVDHIFSKLEISSRVQLTVMLRERPAR